MSDVDYEIDLDEEETVIPAVPADAYETWAIDLDSDDLLIDAVIQDEALWDRVQDRASIDRKRLQEKYGY